MSKSNKAKIYGNMHIICLLSDKMTRFKVDSKKITESIRNIINDFSHKSLINQIHQSRVIVHEISIMENVELTSYFNITPYTLNKYIFHISSGSYGMTFRVDDNFIFKFIINQINSQFHEYEIPHKLSKLLQSSKCDRFILCPSALIKDVDLLGLINIILAHNIIIILIKSIIDPSRDVNIAKLYVNEEQMIKLYKDISINSNFYKCFTYFYNKYFKELFDVILINNYAQILNQISYIMNKYKNLDKLQQCSLLIIPLAICTSNELKLSYYENIYIPDMKNGTLASLINPHYIRHIILQMMLILYHANKLGMKFIHNDLKPNNILVFLKNDDITIDLPKHKVTFKECYYFKLSDFDLSNFKNFSKVRIEGTICEKCDNIIYDIVYFILSLQHVFFTNLKEIDTELYNGLHNYFMSTISKKDISDRHYIGSKKYTCGYLLKFITESKLFDDWLSDKK